MRFDDEKEEEEEEEERAVEHWRWRRTTLYIAYRRSVADLPEYCRSGLQTTPAFLLASIVICFPAD